MPVAQGMLGIMELITMLGGVTLVGAKAIWFVYRGGQVVGIYITYKGGKRVYKALKKRKKKKSRARTLDRN